jgi:Tol biopolymer transport system component
MFEVLKLFFGLWFVVLLAACSSPGVEPEEPHFRPGEYGGNPLPGTESLNNVRLSPDGRRVALVREITPGDPFSPRRQIWLLDADGTNPELLALGAGTIDWSPDGSTLAVTASPGGISIDSYIYTIDLDTREVQPWTGLEDQVISMGTAHVPTWFQDGKRLLVSVYTRAYLQSYDRGIYIIDTETGETTGSLLDLTEVAVLSNNDRSAVGIMYQTSHTPQSGNLVRYDFETGGWQWITTEPMEQGLSVQAGWGNPATELVAQPQRIANAEQLFLMKNDGTQRRQITELGGDVPRWTYDGRRIIFRRDVHRGEGARYVPFVYDVESGAEFPLWPALPDSVPQFPPLETQNPVSIPFP